MNTFQLTCFLTVAETLNFARAAEQLHITQPAVTQQIQSLEKELGVKLFKRTTRTVKITPEGNSFIDDARHIVVLTNRAKRRFENPFDREITLLSLGCYSYTQLFLLKPVLEKLSSLYQNLHPRLIVSSSHHLHRLLEDNDLDAIIGFREPELQKKGLPYQELRRMPLVCICAPTSPLAGQSSIRLEALENERVVLIDPARSQSVIAHAQSQLMGGRSPSEFYFCESIEAVMVLTSAGYGISILPEFFLPPNLPMVSIPIEDIAPVSFGIFYKSTADNAALQSLLSLMREEI